ncbi:MAG: PKD domain-containing protein [Saprospiraceae bacterium]|nr:PKD domain-containing protein [Saprospiraceae bacterium]
MRLFYHFLSVSFFFAFPHFLLSQNAPDDQPCGSDYLYQTILQANPEIALAKRQMDEMLLERQLSQERLSNPDTDETIVLPVVFHIIHQNGPENISDDRIHRALEYLNKAFAHSGEYAENGPGANVRIQFCLAQRDPNGAPTTGITRTESALTNILVNPDDILLKNLVRWDPLHYVNIWVVNSILSAAPPDGTPLLGYATLPFTVGSERDGIVMVDNYTGAESAGANGILAHEMGHYLGLYHTFEGGCANDNCLTQGDRVCDTPPDQGTFTACTFNSCHTDADAPAPNPFSTDTLDMTDNFLDYSPHYCLNRFTEGQAERMRNVAMASRVKLTDSPACLEACLSGTIAAMEPAGQVSMLVADTLFLQNLSQNAEQYTWYVNGIATAQTVNFTFIPDQVGFYHIKLVATGATPNCISTVDLYVQATCNLSGQIELSAETGIPGETMQLHASIARADQFEWTINGVFAGVGPDLSTIFPQAGAYTVQVTASNAYCSLTLLRTVPVQIYCAPSAPPQLSYRWNNCTMDIYTVEAYPNGDLLMGGHQCGNPMLMRLNRKGDVLWAKQIGFEYQFIENFVHKISILPDYSAIVYGKNQLNRFLAKVDSNGTVLWIQNLSHYVNTPQMAVQQDGSCLTGSTDELSGKNRYQLFNPEGEIVWERNDTAQFFFLQSLCPRTGGGFYSLYRKSQTQQSIVSRIDETGQILWSKEISSTNAIQFFHSYQIIPEPDGGFSCCFLTYSGFICIAKWSDDGVLLWTNRYSTNSNSPSFDNAMFFKKTPDNGFIFSCAKGSITNGNGADNQAVVKLDNDGAVKWSFAISGFDSPNGWGSEPLARDAVEYQQQTIIPLKVRNGDFFYLMKTTPDGFAGNCVQRPITVQKQPYAINENLVDISLVPALADTTTIPPIDSLAPVAFTLHPYVECPQYPICAENCDNGIDDDGDGFIDCYDPQCNCYANQNCIVPPPSGIRAHVAWESGNKDVNVLSIPIVANLNPDTDTIPEIIIKGYLADNSKKLLIFNGAGANRSQPDAAYWWLGDYEEPASHAAVADIFNDGKPDVIIKTATTLFAFRNYQPQASVPLSYQNHLSTLENGHRANLRPAFADFDNNGVADVYAGNMFLELYNNQNSGNLGYNVISKSDTTKPAGRLAFNNFAYNASSSVAAELLSKNQCGGDPDCDGPELGAGPVMYSVDLTFWDGDPKGITIRKDLNVLDPGSTLWSDGYTATADINLDNTPELVVAGKRNSSYGVYTWNRNGLVKWFPYPEDTPLSGGMPCIANVFDDRSMGYNADYPEIIAASSNRLTCFNLNIANTNPNAPYWWSIPTTDSLGFTAATSFDFNADGYAELVYRDRTHLRILYGGGLPFPATVDAARNWFSMDAPCATADQYPVVADCDGDGEPEITFTSFDAGGPDSTGSLRGRLRVLKVDAPGSWTGSRAVWNQYGYNGAQVKDDLSIPVQQQTAQVFGGGQRPLNRFLGQLPSFNSNFEAIITAANASVSVDSIGCFNENLMIRLRVCNTGLRNLPDSIPIQFYTANPTLTNATPWGNLQHVQMNTAPGHCSEQTFVIPAINGAQFYAVLNDDGSIPRPFNLASGFTPIRVLECQYSDNMIQGLLQWNQPNLYLGPDISTCSANAVTLNAGAGFDAYQWNDGSVEQTYTAAGPGLYSVQVWDVCGFKQSDTLEVRISPQGQLDLGPDLVICAGDTVQLGVNGFDMVSWSPENLVSCASCPVIFTSPGETILLTATGSNADCFASDSIRIVVQDLPTAEMSTTPASNGNANGTATADPLTGLQPFSYQWSTQPIQTGATATNLTPGIYLLTLTDANGCSNVQTVEVTSFVAINDPDNRLLSLQIIPNPAYDQFTLLASFGQAVKGSVSILDVLGTVMFVTDFQGSQMLESINCEQWPAGMYAVVVSLEGQEGIVRRVIVGR